MIVYRVLDIPKMYPVNNSEVWGVMCLLGNEDQSVEDVVLFDEEELAWKFYHEVSKTFEPIKIMDEDDGS